MATDMLTLLPSHGTDEAGMARMIARLVEDQMVQGAGATGGPGDGERGLVAEMLNFAVVASQRLADQQARIAQLESLVMTDELTGIGNRRAFEGHLDRALAAARRHGTDGVIGYFDLNGFKAVNDTFSHNAGDRLLCRVAEVLRDGVRVEDFAGRIGGDEFVVVMAPATPAGAARRLRTLQARIDRLRIPWADTWLGISASLGIEPLDPERSADETVAAADRRMYAEKRAVGPAQPTVAAVGGWPR
ncbi:hypothetical protein CCR80_08800 [Rhodothalassium salexigens]|nr:hypothetical protein [Rhodothalassium salexigens]